ncbi:MAG: hypothetical protein ACLFUU_08820 [Desulfobacteraceae bacterium]
MVKNIVLIVCLSLSLLLNSCGSTFSQPREAYIKANPDISDTKKEAILRGEPLVGMTKEEVRATCGTPNIISQGVGKDKKICDFWGYKRYKVQFDQEGKVIEVE